MFETPHGFFVDDGDCFYRDFDDYFEEYADVDGGLDAVEFVYQSKPVEIKLDAAEIVNDWEETLRLEFDGDLIGKDQIDELQSILDGWCEKQPTRVVTVDIKKTITVPWCEWFGVKERPEQ